MWSSAFPDINLAAGKDVTCYPACHSLATGSHLVDGATNTGVAHTCFEGDSNSRGGLAEGACASTIPKSMEIDLGQEYLIDGMLIVNMQDQNRFRIQDVKVDFKDADGTVVLTTAAITSDENSEDGYVMDLTKTSLQSNVEFDAWKYIPQGDIVQAANFDWTPYKRWCAVDEYWDGAACRDCPVATTSRGGDVPMCCAVDEFWTGQACGACPTNSTGLQYVMCTCATDQFWNDQAHECQTCPTGSFSEGGAATSTTCTSCEANEFWNGTACQTCPTGSTGLQYVMCTCATDQFWNDQAHECQTCPTGSFSEGGAATSTTCMTCPAGQYRNGDAGCGACPTGSTSPGGSVTSCDTCLSQYYKSGSTCVACPTNSVGAGGSATSCTCNDNYRAYWSGSAWSCSACDAPYVKSGSVVPGSTSDTCDDPPACVRELKVERVDGTATQWGQPFYFKCGDVEVDAGISTSKSKLVYPPSKIAWGSCPTGTIGHGYGSSGFRWANPSHTWPDDFTITETLNCIPDPPACRRELKVERIDGYGWGEHFFFSCGDVEVYVGSSDSKSKLVIPRNDITWGSCPTGAINKDTPSFFRWAKEGVTNGDQFHITETLNCIPDQQACQRKLVVDRIDGNVWGAEFEFKCGDVWGGDVWVKAGTSNSRSKTVTAPSDITWGSCPTGAISKVTPSVFRWENSNDAFGDQFHITETLNC